MTTDRRGVQVTDEMVKAAMEAYGIRLSHEEMRDYGVDYYGMRNAIVVAISLLPSSNAQAVAWQYRSNSIRGGWSEWSDCTQQQYDTLRRSVAVETGCTEVRALCVCSGDAKEA